MAEIVIDGTKVLTEQDFYRQFFDQRGDLFPDYGGRNKDALHDDLRELTEPLVVIWNGADASRAALFGLFDGLVATLRGQGQEDQPVVVELR